MVQSFGDARLVSFAPDVWDGADANADLFQDQAGISFPVLLNAGYLAAPDQYNCFNHYCFVVDGDGVVQYRGAGYNEPAIDLVIQEALNRLPDVTAVGETPGAGFALEANYPNPFNPSTTIPFSIAPERDGEVVRLDVLDLRGRLVRTLVNGPRAAGRHEVAWDGIDASGRVVPSGSYLVRLRTGESEQTRLASLLK